MQRRSCEINVTQSVPAIRRNARNKNIRIRYANGTVITRLKDRKGRLLYLRKRGNDTRIVRLRRKKKRRGDNVTIQMRSRHRKPQRHHETSTNKVLEEESISSNTEHKNDTILLDNKLAKPRKHNSPSTKKPLRDRSVFPNIESLKDTALSETAHEKQRKDYTPSIEKALQDGSSLLDFEHMKLQEKALREVYASTDTERKKDATLMATNQQKHHASSSNKDSPVGSALNAIDLVKNLALPVTEGSKDTTLSDTQRMHLSSTIKSVLRAGSDLSNSESIIDDISSDNEDTYQSTEKSLHPSASSSSFTTKRKKHIVLSDTELKKYKSLYDEERTKPLEHVMRTKKDTQDESDFSDFESKDSVEDRSYRWPKRKRKKVGRQGGKHGGKHNKYNYDTGTTKCKKTTKADLGDELKPYTVKAHMNALKREFQSANITIEVIGRTMSYYDIVMLKVSENKQYDEDEVYFRAHENKYADDGPEKKIVFIVHGLSVMGIHSLPCLLAVKPFKKLLSYYLAHLNKFDIFLIPMANPDGVAVPGTNYKKYSTYNGMDWNKNTSPQSECPGVALDRNFDVAWDIKRNLSSCNQQYPGPHAFSELETKAIRDVLHRYSQRIVAYLNVHAGTYSPKIFKGDAVLYPKGYTEVQSEDDKYIDLRGEIEEALKNASFQVYTVNVDSLYSWYGKVGGTSVDYADKVYGIPYALELAMQLYGNTPKSDEEEEEQNAVLSTSWRRVIGVIFNSVQRYVNATGA